MEPKNSPRKAAATAVHSSLQGLLSSGFNVLPNIGNPYAFTVIDPEGRRFRVSVKESE